MEICFEHFTNDATLITPNRRLAATLTKKYHQHQINNGLVSWPSLDILPYASWLQRLWQHYFAKTFDEIVHVLSIHQEMILWEEILRQSPFNDSLLQISETAVLAKTAFDILQQWQLPLDHSSLTLTEDSRAFLEWANKFVQQCEDNQWIHTGKLPKILTKRIKDEQISLPKKIVVIGFTELTPEQQAFFSCCQQHGTEVIFLENFTLKNSADLALKRIALENTEKEIETMARFAKIHSQKGTVGCIVPHLEKNRDRVYQIFSEVFQNDDTLFNISAGKSLSKYPVIAAAIQLLRLTVSDVSISDFSEILCSPFLGDAEYEYHQRANFDLILRKTNITTDLLKKILTAHEKLSLKKYCPKLFARFTTMQAIAIPRQLPIHQWVEVFMEILTTLGWPGERSVNSHEYQVIHRFLNVLQEYQSIANILAPIKYYDALHYLLRILSSTVFQPESHDAPVQVLGMLEAADIPFDYLWVMNMDDTTWPATAKPNPFIPNILQRKHRMPHANAERELHYSLRLLEQLKHSTNVLIFSHAKITNDCERFPSALTKMITETTLTELSLSDYIPNRAVIFHARELEAFHDEIAPALLPDEKIHGGVNILKQQAACPFKAFAEIRLHAETLPSQTLGLPATERGIIVHKVLELLWKKIENSDVLKKLSDAELTRMLTENIYLTIKEFSDGYESRYMTLEIERMHSLIWEWLMLEKNRPDFKVMSVEQKREVKIGPLELTLRIDRIDQLSDGSHLIIDYKTSKNNSLKYWFTERPDEPQLPLYCITHSAETGGIAFAEIQAKTFSLKGISKNALDIKTMIPFHKVNFAENKTWNEQLQSWQHILEKMSHDFYQGVASVDPKNPAETCQYCDLQSLCRIHEKRVKV